MDTEMKVWASLLEDWMWKSNITAGENAFCPENLLIWMGDILYVDII